jgi:tetratricopeptide (TPR) repeat protein
MIVKEEASYIEDCIKSALPIIDEIIVIDTGSADGTAEIAKKYGGKIFHHKWQDSFSAARNVYIEHAVMDWIFVLDADEMVDSENLIKIDNLVSDEVNHTGFSFILRNYTNDSATLGWSPSEANNPFRNEFGGWYPTRSIRLFRNIKDIHYTRTVHESVRESINKVNGSILDVDIPIHHLGSRRGKKNKSMKMEMYERLGKRQIQFEPEDAQAYFELGRIYRERGEYEMAGKMLSKANELDEGYPQVHNELGIVYLRQERFDDAKAAFKNAVLLHPAFADAYYNLGNLYERLNDLDRATKLYHKAIETNPQFANAYNNLGLVLDERGKINDAISAYLKAIEINPTLTLSYNNLGISLLKISKYYEAIEGFKKAIELDNSYFKAHYNLANTYVRISKYNDAVRLYLKCIEIAPVAPEPFFNLGLIYSTKLQDNKHAMEYWRRYIELRPDSAEAVALTKLLDFKFN